MNQSNRKRPRSESHALEPDVPRFAPDKPLPPYAYVPGRFPHPVRDPEGHSFGTVPEAVPVPEPQRWQTCELYLHGIDLFNHGYYWEAHEAWEPLWVACGRAGLVGQFLEGLIKLAAAGVKLRQGRPIGIERHARNAAGLFKRVAARLDAPDGRLMGLRPRDLASFAAALSHVPSSQALTQGLSDAKLDHVLRPR